MQATNRWRNWKPIGEKFEESALPQLTKPPKPTSVSFVSSIPGQMRNFSEVIPAHDPAALTEDFHRWALDRCCFRDRCFGGIGPLHADFCEHQMARNDVPCQRSVFEALLRNAGFLFADGLVSGLLLKTDIESQARQDYRARRPRK